MTNNTDGFDFLDTLGSLTGDDDSLSMISRLPSPPILSDYQSDLQSDFILPSLTDLPEIGDFLSLPIPQHVQPQPIKATPVYPTPSPKVFKSMPPPITQIPSSSTHYSLAQPSTHYPLVQPASFPTFAPLKAKVEPAQALEPLSKPKEKKRRKSTTGKNPVTQEDRASARKIKHRLIDRARRKRVKDSIDQLKDLVHFEPHEKPDKATIVSSAVREIQDLKSQVAQLQAQLSQMSVTSSPTISSPSSTSSSTSLTPTSSIFEIPESPPQEEKMFLSSIITDKIPIGFHLPSFLSGLGGAGVMALMLGMDCRLREVNGLFETITGFRREEVSGVRFMDAPLYGRNVHGKYPSRFVKSSDPTLSLIPTASATDLACPDFKKAVSALVGGGTFKVVCRLLTRDGRILESLNTFFLLRNERGEPAALCAMSTPDCRRLIILNHRNEEQDDLFVDVPTHIPQTPTIHPAFRPFADDFLTPLATQT